MPTETIDAIDSPGIVRDIPPQRLPKGSFSDGKNYRFGQRGAEPHAGDRGVLSEASITPLWLYPFPPITNPRWVYANLTEAWVVEGSTHTEITRTASDYNGSAQERWNATVLNGIGVLNNAVDVPQAWTDFEPTTKLVDLANWPATHRAKVIRSFRNFLVALYVTESSVDKPYRVLWSSAAAPGTIPGSWDVTDPAEEANQIDLAETDDYLVDCLPLGDINIVYKENSTWGMAFIGAPNYFRFWNILPNHGLLHRDCATRIPRGHVVATQDDLIVHSGQIGDYNSILDRKSRAAIFNNIDPTNFRNCFIFTDVALSEVWFCYPEVGETYASKAVIWDWRTNSIGERALTPTPFASVGPVGDSLDSDREWG